MSYKGFKHSEESKKKMSIVQITIHKHRDQKGKNNPNWKGGKRIDDYGYVCINMPNHPRAKSNGYVKEHILVMEKIIGRALQKGEVVHHINGNRADNRPENLKLYATQGQHHVTEHMTKESQYRERGSHGRFKKWG